MAVSTHATSSLTQWKERQQQSAEQVDLQALLSHLRAALRAQGLVVWVNVGLALDKAQTDSGCIGNATLKRVLNDHRVAVSDVDARALIQRLTLQVQHDGRVSADDVKNLLCGTLTGRKLQLVQNAFDLLDRQGVGYLALQDVLAAHDAARHPAVMFGEQTVDQVVREFQAAFLAASRRTGTAFVSWTQWLAYFQCVAAQAPSDEYFELLMKRVWRAATRCSLQDAAGAEARSLDSRLVEEGDSLGSVEATAASVAPVSLLQALQHTPPTGDKAKMALSISTAPPSKPFNLQHRANGMKSPANSEVESPRAAATTSTTEFLKGSQFAACLTESPLPPSPVSNARSSGTPKASSLDAGAASVLRKLQTGLRSRGLHALVSLGRSLRVSDQDGDAMVTLQEFRRTLQSAHENVESPQPDTNQSQRSPLSDADLRSLFLYLDCDRNGLVRIEDALEMVRGPMTTRRLRLVHAAYQVLAREAGVRLLDACDVVQRYDASHHPDVIAQRKSEEDCFREFVENFDVEEDSEPHRTGCTENTQGKISPQQWEAYYRNVSFFVSDDDLFELMVRNTWQLPSPTSPAVTNSNARTGSKSNTDSPRGSPAVMEAPRRTRETPDGGPVRGRRSSNVGTTSAQAFCILQPDLVDNLPSSSNGLAPSALELMAPRSPGAGTKQSKELRRTVHQLRCLLKEQGIAGFITLQRQLRRAAGKPEEAEGVGTVDDGNVDFQAFGRALRDSGVRMTGRDMQSLFYHFDSNHDGAMSVAEFLAGIREPMTTHRQLVVRMAFDALDRSGSGELAAADVAASFDARRLPEVMKGRKTEQEARSEFLETFGLAMEHQRQRRVDFRAWERYYTNVSASIDEDEYFEQMMRNAWHLSPSGGTRGSEAVPDAVEKSTRFAQRRDPPRSGFYDILNHSTPQNSVGAGSGAAFNSSVTLRRARNNASTSIAACLGKETGARSDEVPADTVADSISPGRRDYHQHPAGVQAILSKLKLVLQAQGTPGFCTLSRRLQTRRGNALNLQELRDAAADCELTVPGALTDGDLRLLFQYLDHDGDGRVSSDELMAAVRPALVGRRLDCVRQAFAKLAKGLMSDGSVLEALLLEPSDVVEEFDAAAHPDVLAGRRGADHVCREFLETFDVDGGAGPQDGKITWDQWRGYYHNVSASIAADDLFEQMVRGVWHIGPDAGSSNEDTRMDVPMAQQQQQRRRGSANISTLDLSMNPPPVSVMGNQKSTAETSESPRTHPPLANGRKIMSLKDVASGASLVDANRSAGLRAQSEGDEVAGTHAGDTILHAIRRRIRQSNSLADVVQLRARLAQAADPRTGTITSLRCGDALNAALGLSLSEAYGRALFEHLAQLPEFSGDIDAGVGSSMGARFLHQQNKLHGNDNGKSVYRLPLRLVVESLLGRLSPACLESAMQVFSALQTTGKGRVFPAALASNFQAANHPDVLLGRLTATQAFQDFALNFEVASSDGAIAFQHFEAYCVNLRATLGSDELLQLLLRDCFNARPRRSAAGTAGPEIVRAEP